jgi:hypothetical protein
MKLFLGDENGGYMLYKISVRTRGKKKEKKKR